MSQARYSIMPTAALEDKTLSAQDIRVLAALGSYLDKDAEGWPSQSEIAKRAFCARETVNRTLQKLAGKGYIKVIDRDAGGIKRSKKYRVVLDVILDHNDVTPGDHNRCDPTRHIEDTQLKIPINKNIQKDLKLLSDQFWDATPKAGKARTSRPNIRAALNKLLKADSAADPDLILKAWQRYIAGLKAKQKQEYTKGCHSWLNNNLFEAWIPAEPDIFMETGPEHRAMDPSRSLDDLFWEFAQIDRWSGGNYGYPLPPTNSRAEYPAELYEKHGIARPKS